MMERDCPRRVGKIVEEGREFSVERGLLRRHVSQGNLRKSAERVAGGRQGRAVRAGALCRLVQRTPLVGFPIAGAEARRGRDLAANDRILAGLRRRPGTDDRGLTE